MNNLQYLAMQWWEVYKENLQDKLQTFTDKYYKYRNWDSLSDQEIESIFYNEIVIKWFQENCKTKNIVSKSRKIEMYLKGKLSAKSGLNLDEMRQNLYVALEKETTESLGGWLSSKRMGQSLINRTDDNFILNSCAEKNGSPVSASQLAMWNESELKIINTIFEAIRSNLYYVKEDNNWHCKNSMSFSFLEPNINIIDTIINKSK